MPKRTRKPTLESRIAELEQLTKNLETQATKASDFARDTAFSLGYEVIQLAERIEALEDRIFPGMHADIKAIDRLVGSTDESWSDLDRRTPKQSGKPGKKKLK